MNMHLICIPSEHLGSVKGTTCLSPLHGSLCPLTCDLTGAGWEAVEVCRMGPPLVIQVDRKGELDARGSAAAFDLPRASSQRILVALTLCLPPAPPPAFTLGAEYGGGLSR